MRNFPRANMTNLQSPLTTHSRSASRSSAAISRQMKWYLKYYKWVKVVKDSSLGLTDYRIEDERGEEIQLRSSAAAMSRLQDREVEIVD